MILHEHVYTKILNERVLTCYGRGFDDCGRAEEGGSVRRGGDGGVEVAGGGFGGLVGGALGSESGRRTATGLLDREPRVEAGVEAEDAEVLRRGSRLGQQEVVLMGRQRVEPVHDHGRQLRRARWTAYGHQRRNQRTLLHAHTRSSLQAVRLYTERAPAR